LKGFIEITVTEGKRVLVETLPEHYSMDLKYISVRHFNRDNRLHAGKGTHNQKNFIAVSIVIKTSTFISYMKNQGIPLWLT
jgi:hypothetical protein